MRYLLIALDGASDALDGFGDDLARAGVLLEEDAVVRSWLVETGSADEALEWVRRGRCAPAEVEAVAVGSAR
jgi:hypothetical protein